MQAAIRYHEIHVADFLSMIEPPADDSDYDSGWTRDFDVATTKIS